MAVISFFIGCGIGVIIVSATTLVQIIKLKKESKGSDTRTSSEKSHHK